MDILSKFGENLSELLFDHHLTTREFARRVQIDYSLVYKYLRKEYLPTLANLIIICDFFSCSVDYILGFSVEHYQTPYKSTEPFCVRFQTLLQARGQTRYKFLKEAKELHFHFGRQTVDDWFHGKRLPTVDNLIELSKYFNCTLDFLLGREA